MTSLDELKQKWFVNTADILLTFTERWNDLATSGRTTPRIEQPLPEPAGDLPAAVGPHSVTIYIEDQYLYPFGDPPFIYGPDTVERETDYVYQLGLALKRGVDVVALVPGRDDSLPKHYENSSAAGRRNTWPRSRARRRAPAASWWPSCTAAARM